MSYTLKGEIKEKEGARPQTVSFPAPILSREELDYVLAAKYEDELMNRYIEVTDGADEVYDQYWSSMRTILQTIEASDPSVEIELTFSTDCVIELESALFSVSRR